MNRLRPYLTPRRLIAIIAAALVVALGALLVPLALAGPRVLSVTPADGAGDANPQAPIQIVFDQWVWPDSVAAALQLDPPARVTVTGPTFPRPGATTVLIQPQDGLRYGARYRLTIGSGVKNLLGRTLDRPLTIAFATVPYVTVARLGPERGATDVPLNAPIIVEFGAPVVPTDAIAAAARDPRLADGMPQPIELTPPTAGVGRWLAPTLFGFYPADGLHAATTYTATVRADLTPDGKARLEQPVAWSFSTAAPLLAGARPYDGATEVAADSAIEVRLAKDVDVASAGAHFSLREAASGTEVKGTVQPGGSGFLFKPAAPLQRGARYEAHLAPGIRSTTGAVLNPRPLTWSFSVIGDLEVAQVEPPADATGVLTSTRRISVRFNHPVVAVTAIDRQASLPQPLTITPPLPGVGRWIDTSTYVYSPTTALTPSTGYRVRVAAGLQDQTGGVLRQEYAWGFHTITPQVLGSMPPDGAQYASPNGPIVVVFNQPMEPAGLAGAIRLRNDATGAEVPGTLATVGNMSVPLPEGGASEAAAGQATTISGSAVTFTPAAPLERGTSYTLLVARGLRAAQGDGVLASGYRASFRVAPLPQLLGSSPADGEQAAQLNQGVALTFSTPMDWASVEQNLTIEPRPSEVYTSSYETQFSLYFTLAPETDYRVTVGAAARDPYGVPLGQEATVRFRTGALPPALAIVGPYQFGAYNAHTSARVPVRHVNVPQVSYAIYRLEPTQAARLSYDYDAWRTFQPDPAALVRQGDRSLPGDRNQERVDLLEVGPLEAGLYVFQLIGPDTVDPAGRLYDQQIMAVSPYALTIKRSADQVFVWAVDLASGQPVADLPLEAATFVLGGKPSGAPSLSEPRALGRTDAEGILKASYSAGDPYAPLFLWSPAGERFVFATTGWGEGISPWDFGLPADYSRRPFIGGLFTDRPIYRPRQTVYIRGAIRMDDDGRYSLPAAGRRAHLAITDPQGSVVLSTTLPLSEFGTFNTSLALDTSAAIGSYSMVGRLEGESDAQAFYGSFWVAEYRKPAFEVTVVPAQPDLIQGETLVMNVTASYFSGGAVANAPVRWRLLARPLYFAPDSAPGFRFEDLEDAYAWYRWGENQPGFGGDLVSDGTARTDAQGRFTLRLPAELGKDGHSRTLTLDVEVTDLDGQVIAAQGTANVHAGGFYIGLRPAGYVAQAGQPQQVALITRDVNGRPVSGRQLQIGIYKREWYSVREQGADGRLYWTSHFTDTLVETQAATTDAQGRASITFTPQEGGSYRIGAEGRDDGGHIVKASAFTWAIGGEVFWGVNDTNRVDLIADKDRYSPGETARILVPAPYKGMRALMTIERGTVIEHKLLTLPTTTELLEIPIRADYAPNVYVSIVLVKPVSGAPAEDAPAVPDLRVGLVNLPVSTAQQELQITITPDKAEAGPRDQVTYTIKATDNTGKGVRAEVSLALVDKAVLTLADDPNPSLRQVFYEKRPLGVLTANSLTALVDRVTLKLQAGDKGGGGGGPEEVLVRREFPDTAYWNPALVTGDDGTAQVTLRLPDSLTTWRMTARALTADTRVGQATHDLVATRPLLVRPSLPRFLTVGDQLTLQAVVHNNTASAIDAVVELAIAAPGESQPVELDGPAQQSVQVPANGQAVVRWPAAARTAGEATLRFTVSGGTLSDSVEQVVPVQRFTTPEVVASAGQVQDTIVETIQASGALTATQGEVALELSPSLAAGIARGLDYLEQYPYACTEQTVSRFLPNAVTYRLYQQLGVEDQELKAGLERTLASGLQRIYSLQHLDGGWGWWGADQSHPYLTAYVVQGLIEARKAGYAVDQQVLDAGIGYLESVLNGRVSSPEPQAGPNARATALNVRSYILFVLAEAGQPDRGRTIALFEERAQLAIYGRAYLLMTLKALGGEDERARTLIGELMSSAILRAADAHWEEPVADDGTMSSDPRTTALALQALVRADPTNFLVPNAVRYLMGLRAAHAGARLYASSTQETAVTLMALAEYLAQSGELQADYRYRVALDEKTLREGVVNRDTLADPIDIVIALADLAAEGGQRATSDGTTTAIGDRSSALVIQKSGTGQLYYTLRMRYYQDAATVQPLDQGIGVQREYIAVDSDTLTPTGELVSEAQLGGVVQVRLTLQVPEHVQYLAVEDMLPAGLEPLDTSLKTVSAAAAGPTLQDARAGQPDWWLFTQTEIHDNRVVLFATDLPKGTYHYTYLARATTAGTFQTLPALAYQMYAPEVFGRSAGTTFVVTGP